MGQVRWLDEAEARAWQSFQLMVARLTGFLARDLSAHSELSYADYVVLVVLSAETSGMVRLFELAHRLGWEKSRASHQVARMVERGLVEKHRCASDRRGAFVALTRAGRDQLVAAAPSHVAAVRRVFVDRLLPEQLEQLSVLSALVLEAIEEEERDTCAGYEA
jgi:DNA-binding MarR family transcriptional regulator